MTTIQARRCIAVATVVVLTVVLIAIASRGLKRLRDWRRKRNRFEVGNPAAPREKQSAEDLQVHLASIVNIGREFQNKISGLDEKVRDSLPGGPALSQTVASITEPLERARLTLVSTPRTYANLVAIYRGIAGSDQRLLSTASALETAGHEIHQTLGRDDDGPANFQTQQVGEFGDAGNALVLLGREIRGLLMSVHRLGVTLDLE